jgi:hypothetical protein
MKTRTYPLRSITPLSFLAAALTACVLAACGGGSTASSTPAAPTGDTSPPVLLGAPTVSGTVTGFGSVIVDGVRIDDHAVAAMTERENGLLVAAEMKMGHHVEVQHDGNLVATQVRVMSEVEGAVQAVDLTAHTLKVMGQTVAINSDATLGPVTVFAAPYTQLSDMKVGDNVEVHALIKVDAAGKTSLQATRVEQKTADAFDRVHGIVSELSTTAHTFKLGDLLIDYSAAKLLPDGVVLANGSEVHVSIPSGTVSAGSAAKASFVRVADRKGDSEGKPAELGGAISVLDATAKSMTINGVKVDATAATFNQPGKTFADLKVGTYVVVTGKYGSDKTLKASTIVIRGVDDNHGKEVEIHGTVLDFKSNADFTLRGVAVDASTAHFDPASCAGITVLANNMQIEVEGSLSATGKVVAASVKCETAQDGVSIVANRGTASKVDATAKTFTLTTERGALSVKWTGTTNFIRVDPTSLDGKIVVVEGTSTAGVVTATKVNLAQK